MRFSRRAGLLMHVSSLPGGHGIGDLGPIAYEFVDFLKDAGHRLWQILPLGPTARGNSPYSSYSAFAGNPLLISLDRLHQEGWLRPEELTLPDSVRREGPVDYAAVGPWKEARLALAAQRFFQAAEPGVIELFRMFVAEQSWWLPDFAMFMSLSKETGTADWSQWDPAIVRRDPEALSACQQRLRDSIRLEEWIQFIFHRQWFELKGYAGERGVSILGDLPIFVAYESADVWATQEAFHVDRRGHRTVVAGVPPDYFSATGQLWGNPLYRWDYLAQHGYDWWVRRLRRSLELFDSVRIDHFRGFEAYWEIPADAETAIGGRWVPGPGAAPFRAAERQGVPLRIVAEDLGMISDAVHALREELGFPGMRVFQFGYDDAEGAYHRPENYPVHSAAYTGTHDNDTILGWARGRLSRLEAQHADLGRDWLFGWLGTDLQDVHWKLIERVYASAAEIAVVPIQDVLGLGSEGRMNIPGQSDGNWEWRCPVGSMDKALAEKLRALVEHTERGTGA